MPDQSPAYRNIAIAATVTAGTLISSPDVQSQPQLANVQIVSLELIIPDGHAGRTGWSLRYGGTLILPFPTVTLAASSKSRFIIGNNETVTFDLDFLAGNAPDFVMFNEGVFDHSFYVRAKVIDMANVANRGTPIPVATLPAL